MGDQLVNNDWLQTAGTAIGGFASLRVAEKLVTLVFDRWNQKDARADKEAEQQAEHDLLVSRELRTQVRELYLLLDALNERIDNEQQKRLALVEEISLLKRENHDIRGENHQLRGYLTVLIATAQRYHKLLGFPEEDMPRVPAWLNDSSPGPTSSTHRGTP